MACQPALAGDWHLQIIPLPEIVTRVEIQPGDEPFAERLRLGTYGANWYTLTTSTSGELTAGLGDSWDEEPARGAAGTHDIAEAFYADPTGRLTQISASAGDAYGTLSAFDRANVLHDFPADPDHAFTGRGPKLADLDGDGNDEIVSLEMGAAGSRIAIFRLTLAGLERLAMTPNAGDPQALLDLLGIADIDGDGTLDILVSRTGAGGGRLEAYTYASRSLRMTWTVPGVVTALPGSKISNVAAIEDYDGDQLPDILVPGRDARSIRLLTFRDRALAEPLRIPLPAAISSNFKTVLPDDPADGPTIVFGLANQCLGILSRAAPKPAASAAPEVTP